jgi:FemAB-related protein (PEP-CTERM system-associated)
MGIQIRYCDETEKDKWDDYVKNHSQGNFYQLFEWKSIIEKNFGHGSYYLAAYDDDIIIGVLPLVFINSRIFGKIISSMPFVNYGGILFDISEARDLLIEEAKSIAQSVNAEFIEIRSNKSIDTALPVSTHKVSMNIKLEKDHEMIWGGYSSKHRNNIRRIYKKGVNVHSGGPELLETFYGVLSRSWKGLGTPFYKIDYFRDIVEKFDKSVKIFVASIDNKPIATAFNGYFKGTVEGMWAGTLEDARKLQPNYVLYWEMIKDACDNNYTIYNLGRSSIGSNAEEFKRKWNSTPTQLYWYYFLNKIDNLPQLNVDNPKYHLAIQAWKKAPKIITDLIGPYIARNIP